MVLVVAKQDIYKCYNTAIGNTYYKRSTIDNRY